MEPTQRDVHHGETLLTFCHRLYEEGELVDVTLTCQGQSFHAHRLVLAAYSRFFYTALMKNQLEKSCLSLDNLGITAQGLKILVHFMYTGILNAEDMAWEWLLWTANLLCMQKAVDVLQRILAKGPLLSPVCDSEMAPSAEHSSDKDTDAKVTPKNQSNSIENKSTRSYRYAVNKDAYSNDTEVRREVGGESVSDLHSTVKQQMCHNSVCEEAVDRENSDEANNDDDDDYIPSDEEKEALDSDIQTKMLTRSACQAHKTHTLKRVLHLTGTPGHLQQKHCDSPKKTSTTLVTSDKEPDAVENYSSTVNVPCKTVKNKEGKLIKDEEHKDGQECGGSHVISDSVIKDSIIAGLRLHCSQDQFDYSQFKSTDKLFHCPVCSLACPRHADFREHLNTHTGERPYSCREPQCRNSFKSRKGRRIHEKSHSGLAELLERLGKNAEEKAEKNVISSHAKKSSVSKPFKYAQFRDEDMVYHCPECPYSTLKRESFRSHLRSHSDERPYTCSYCDKTYKDPKALRAHKRLHTGEKPFTCPKCPMRFNCRNNMSRHVIAKHSGERRYKCAHEGCTYAAADPSTLKKHTVIHQENRTKTILCDICGKKFLSAKILKFHKKTHMEPASKCSVCDYKTTYKNCLISHMMRIHGLDLNGAPVEHSFKCNVCNFATFTKYEFDKHMVKHSGIKALKCPICNFATTEKGTLTKHLRTHTGETPFKCKFCNKNFSNQSSVARHQRVHLGIKPHKCTVCGKAYADKKSLDTHMFKHENLKPYMCHMCSYGCVRKDVLLKHIHKAHGPQYMSEEWPSKGSNKYSAGQVERENSTTNNNIHVANNSHSIVETNVIEKRNTSEYMPDQLHSVPRAVDNVEHSVMDSVAKTVEVNESPTLSLGVLGSSPPSYAILPPRFSGITSGGGILENRNDISVNQQEVTYFSSESSGEVQAGSWAIKMYTTSETGSNNS